MEKLLGKDSVDLSGWEEHAGAPEHDKSLFDSLPPLLLSFPLSLYILYHISVFLLNLCRFSLSLLHRHT